MKFWYEPLKKFITAMIVVLIALIIYLCGIVFTEHNYDWFITLNQPAIRPPSWSFMLIWAVLFIMIATSAIIVLFHSDATRKKCNLVIALFILNALLNTLWSIIFFGFHNITLALIELPFFLASIVILILCSWKVSKIASLLLVPYLIWAIYATILMVQLQFIN